MGDRAQTHENATLQKWADVLVLLKNRWKLSNNLFDCESSIFTKKLNFWTQEQSHVAITMRTLPMFSRRLLFLKIVFLHKTLFRTQNAGLRYPEFVTLGCRQLLDPVWPQHQESTPPVVFYMLHKHSKNVYVLWKRKTRPRRAMFGSKWAIQTNSWAIHT